MSEELQKVEIQVPKRPKILPLDIAKPMPVEGRTDGRAVAYGYGRVSTDEQKKGFSEANQRANIETYCRTRLADKGVAWGGFYADDEGTSAFAIRAEDRKAFKEILIQIKAGDYLIVDKVDRLFRSMHDFVNTLMLINRMGVVLVINDMNGASIQSDTPMGDFVLHLQVAIAQMESQQISKRVKAGFTRKFLTVPGFGFCRPKMQSDWMHQPKDSVGMPWVPHLYERDIMRFCYETRAAGVGREKTVMLLDDYVRHNWKGKIPQGCKPPGLYSMLIERLKNREAYILDAEDVMAEKGLTYQEAFETIGVPKRISWDYFYQKDFDGLDCPRLKEFAQKKHDREKRKKGKTVGKAKETVAERNARTKAESKKKRLEKLGWA